MKPISSAITTLPKEPSSKTGQPDGAHGLVELGSGNTNAVDPDCAAVDLAPQWRTSSQLLMRYSERWAQTPPGTPVGEIIPAEHRAATLSMLSQCLYIGSPEQVGEIIKRLWAHDPKTRPLEKTVAQDWRMELEAKPLACIWWAYRDWIRKDETWAPNLGAFLKAVELHETRTLRIVNQLKAAIREGA